MAGLYDIKLGTYSIKDIKGKVCQFQLSVDSKYPSEINLTVKKASDGCAYIVYQGEKQDNNTDVCQFLPPSMSSISKDENYASYKLIADQPSLMEESFGALIYLTQISTPA